jgi:hypothetical protein
MTNIGLPVRFDSATAICRPAARASATPMSRAMETTAHAALTL